jgi:hypothetical protein
MSSTSSEERRLRQRKQVEARKWTQEKEKESRAFSKRVEQHRVEKHMEMSRDPHSRG